MDRRNSLPPLLASCPSFPDLDLFVEGQAKTPLPPITKLRLNKNMTIHPPVKGKTQRSPSVEKNSNNIRRISDSTPCSREKSPKTNGLHVDDSETSNNEAANTISPINGISKRRTSQNVLTKGRSSRSSIGSDSSSSNSGDQQQLAVSPSSKSYKLRKKMVTKRKTESVAESTELPKRDGDGSTRNERVSTRNTDDITTNTFLIVPPASPDFSYEMLECTEDKDTGDVHLGSSDTNGVSEIHQSTKDTQLETMNSTRDILKSPDRPTSSRSEPVKIHRTTVEKQSSGKEQSLQNSRRSSLDKLHFHKLLSRLPKRQLDQKSRQPGLSDKSNQSDNHLIKIAKNDLDSAPKKIVPSQFKESRKNLNILVTPRKPKVNRPNFGPSRPPPLNQPWLPNSSRIPPISELHKHRMSLVKVRNPLEALHQKEREHNPRLEIIGKRLKLSEGLVGNDLLISQAQDCGNNESIEIMSSPEYLSDNDNQDRIEFLELSERLNLTPSPSEVSTKEDETENQSETKEEFTAQTPRDAQLNNSEQSVSEDHNYQDDYFDDFDGYDYCDYEDFFKIFRPRGKRRIKEKKPRKRYRAMLSQDQVMELNKLRSQMNISNENKCWLSKSINMVGLSH